MLPRAGVKLASRRSSHCLRRRPAAALATAMDEPPPPPGAPKKLAKRKLALHVAYVGTGYRGLQWQPPHQSAGASGLEPVENVLERALAASGAILPTNAGAPSKIAWTRASRTDRGVHAAPGVVALRAECDPASFEGDPEGLAFAAAADAHLPPTIRVLSAQRVAGGFDARHNCETREYEFYLPAWLLAAPGAGRTAGADADPAALAALRAALTLYVGPPALPFHCFTKRAEYRKGKGKEGGDGDGDGRRRAPRPAATASASSSSFDDDGDETRPLPVRPVWHGDTPPAHDEVGPSHFRLVTRAAAADPAPLVPGAPPAIALSFAGSSFMLHQLRHMVGAAVAVARGALPLGAVAAALAPPARVALPLAPPHTLVLTGATFGLHPTAALGDDPAPWTGDRLELRAGGAAARDAWRTDVLLPSLSAALAHPDYAAWDALLDRLTYEEGEMAAFVEAGRAWRASAADRAAARVAARAAEKEAGD